MGSTKLRRIYALAQTHTINYEIAPKAGRAYVIYITEIDGEHFSRSVPKAQMANNLLAYLWYTEQPKRQPILQTVPHSLTSVRPQTLLQR